ncbi:MAG: PilZ domain-containing protein [Candidatus Omnitrophota bacterium]|jgi:hypothetical protein
MSTEYCGEERRDFMRMDHITPLAYKVCRQDTINKLLQGYTSDISRSGLLCNIKDRVNKDDILWLSFERGTLNILEELEKKSLIYQNGIIGKVVRIEDRGDTTYNVGVQFITRQEKGPEGIYSRLRFVKDAFGGEGK